MLAQTDQSRSETWPWSWTKSLNNWHVFSQFDMSQQVFPIISLPQLNWLIKLFIFPLLCPSFFLLLCFSALRWLITRHMVFISSVQRKHCLSALTSCYDATSHRRWASSLSRQSVAGPHLSELLLSESRHTPLNFGVQLRSLKLDQGIVVGIRHRIKWCHQESENEKDHFLSQHCLDRWVKLQARPQSHDCSHLRQSQLLQGKHEPPWSRSTDKQLKTKRGCPQIHPRVK